jgi:glycosyltransferase involved in cell wall biosynthesis
MMDTADAAMAVKRHLLILSIYYPPFPSIASERLSSFAKYIDKNLFDVTVICLDPDIKSSDVEGGLDANGARVFRLPNHALLKKALFNRGSGRIVHKLKALYNILLGFIFLDEYRTWVKAAVALAERLIGTEGVSFILSSYAPVAPHRAALTLKKRYPLIRWIADMRDEMSANCFLPAIMRRRLKPLEKDIMCSADAVTTVSKPILNDFRKASRKKDQYFEEVRNGFDFDLGECPSPQTKRFVIAYTGTMYGRYTPYVFFSALERLLVEHGNSIKFDIRIVGTVKPLLIAPILRPYITFEKQVPHAAAVEIMKQSSLLLLFHPKGGRKGVYTGKLFEYLASLRPILAIVDPTDVAACLIREAKAGYIADSDNIEEIKLRILEAYRDWKEGKPYLPNREIILRHHRREQAQILQNLIERLEPAQ